MDCSKRTAAVWMMKRPFWDFRVHLSFVSRLTAWECFTLAKNIKYLTILWCFIDRHCNNWPIHSSQLDPMSFRMIRARLRKTTNWASKLFFMNWPAWIERGAKSMLRKYWEYVSTWDSFVMFGFLFFQIFDNRRMEFPCLVGKFYWIVARKTNPQWCVQLRVRLIDKDLFSIDSSAFHRKSSSI